MHPADQLVRQRDKAIADAALIDQLAGEDEERNGHEREVGHAADRVLHDQLQRQIQIQIRRRGSKAHGDGNADAGH